MYKSMHQSKRVMYQSEICRVRLMKRRYKNSV